MADVSSTELAISCVSLDSCSSEAVICLKPDATVETRSPTCRASAASRADPADICSTVLATSSTVAAVSSARAAVSATLALVSIADATRRELASPSSPALSAVDLTERAICSRAVAVDSLELASMSASFLTLPTEVVISRRPVAVASTLFNVSVAFAALARCVRAICSLAVAVCSMLTTIDSTALRA